jgi:cyclopropane-fatty-acyl-phospholipid synthase
LINLGREVRSEEFAMKSYTDEQQVVAIAGHVIIKKILADYHGPVAVRLWNGELAVGDESAPCTIVFNHPSVLRQLILHRDVVHVAEDYLAEEADIEGDVECLFDLVSYMRDLVLPWSTKLRLMRQALTLPNHPHDKSAQSLRAGRAKRHNTKQSIAHHYDVGNDFYRLWLDQEMVYSCAYFSNPDQTLDDAQRDKLDYICRKLRLTPGETLLDIGCGWGALVCWAAKQYGVKAHGITLSEQQVAYAKERIHKEGLDDQVTVELLDYRDLPSDARYDRVVSVGMFEHIGVDNFPLYFEIIKRVLAPGGLFLNHGITNDTGWQDTPITRFINSYVFPDGELARIGDVITAMENAGFEIIDVEGLRRHYAMTLRCWVKALEENKKQIVDIVGEATYRVWRLYMEGSAYYFNEGAINVFQALAGHDREPLTVGLRRDELYEKGCECQPACLSSGDEP